jgi:tyrosinase
MGSNGAAIPHNATTINAFGLTFSVPAATGGGCISGPFSDYTVNLGPVAFAPSGPDGGLGYNPRCLSRDISLVWANNTKPTDVVRLVNGCTDLGCFDTACEAIDGVHGGGHFIMGGLGLDAWSSPGDPAFWLHHAMVDRVWSLWQGVDPKNRVGMVYGTGTAFNGKSLICLL